MPRVSLILCLFITAILSLSSCVASSRSIPEKGILTPAEYSTQYFKPALSFRTDGYWLVRGQNYDYLDIAPLRSEIDFMGSTSLAFFNVPRVYDPDKPLNDVGSDNTLSAPKDADGMFRWLHEHPSLTTEEPDFTEHDIGGSTENPSYAVRFDAVVSSVSKNRPSDCSSPCLALFRVSDGSLHFSKGERCRFFIVDVRGVTVVIVYSGPADEFSKFEPAASELLTTVRWIDE